MSAFTLVVFAVVLQVDARQELQSGSEEEVEIRAASILAVEQLKAAANKLLTAQDSTAEPLLSIQLDWWLWQEGERTRNVDTHHKTWTIYY